MRGPSEGASEIVQALDKADEYARRAAAAKTANEHDHYERMRRTWLGIANSWRVIVEADQMR